MSLFRFVFWRFYRKPVAGEWWDYCDHEYDNDPFVVRSPYLIMETRGNWALISRNGVFTPRSVHFRTMVSFYRPGIAP